MTVPRKVSLVVLFQSALSSDAAAAADDSCIYVYTIRNITNDNFKSATVIQGINLQGWAVA